MERVESLLFRANKEKLKAEGNKKCFICGTDQEIEVHHIFCAWSRQQEADYEKLKEVTLCFDVYGYSHEMKEQAITSVDDIRNLICLCEGHHKRTDHGIHNIPFGDWIMQRVKGETNENRKDV